MKNQQLYQLLDLAHQYSIEYIASINNRSVFPSDSDLENLSVFDETMPVNSSDPVEVLGLLHTNGSPATVAQTGGRYFGFVNGGMYPASLAARWLADTWDQNSALWLMSPVVSKLEEICEKWLVDLFRLPEDTAAGLVSGTSISLACGLAAGRNELLRRLGWDVVAKGLFGAPEIKVVLSQQAHATVFKALSFLGLGKDRVCSVPCDEQGRMRVDEIPPLDDTSLLVLCAGNVNTGSFDDFKSICKLAKAKNAWVHIDGAFGLWAAGSRNTYPLYEGAELADSWSVDAHKTLNAPYECGVIMCKDRAALVTALQATGSYIHWSEHRDGMLYTPEMSRRARSVELWMLLKTMGKSGIEHLIDQLCSRTKLFEQQLKQQGFRILNDVVFNQILVACDNPDETQATLDNIQRSGKCWCGGSSWLGETVIRISVCSHTTTEQDVEQSARIFAKARERARSS